MESVWLMLAVAVVVLMLELAIVGLMLASKVVPSKNRTTVDELVLLVSKPDTVAEIEVAAALLALAGPLSVMVVGKALIVTARGVEATGA